MAWTPQSNYAAVNATLKADPRDAAALQRYQQTLRANPTPTIAQQRQDDTGQIATQAADAAQAAKQAFAKTAHDILVDHGITDQERLGFSPDSGAVAYEPPDHSTRNILIGLGAIATAGVLTGALGGGAAVGGATLPTATGVGGLSATSTGLPITAGLGTAGTVGTVGAGAGAGAVGAGAGAAGAGAGGAGSVIPPATYGAGNVVTNFANVPPDVAGRTYGDLLRYGLPTAGGVVDSIIKANAEGKASDAQQRYLQQALDYQKESDLYKRGVDAAAVAKEAARYGDYQSRIGPFIDNGISSNDRMSALLGLPARTGGGGGGSGPPASQRVPIDAATQQAIRDELRAANSSDNPEAWDEYLSSHGDSSVKNWDYWKHRIDTGEGVGKGYGGAAAPPASSTPPAAPASSARNLVQMRAPDGSVQQVPADQADYYRQRGAVPV